MVEELSFEPNMGAEYLDRTKDIAKTDIVTKSLLAENAIHTGNFEIVRTNFEAIRTPYRSKLREFLGTSYEPSALLTYASTLYDTSATKAIQLHEDTRRQAHNKDMFATDIATIAIAHKGNIQQVLDYHTTLSKDEEVKKLLRTEEGLVTLTSTAMATSVDEAKRIFLEINSKLPTQGDGETQAILTQAVITRKHTIESVIDTWNKFKQLQHQKQSKLHKLSDDGIAILTVASALNPKMDMDSTMKAFDKFLEKKGVDPVGAARLTIATIGARNQIAVIPQENIYYYGARPTNYYINTALLYLGKYR